MTATASALDEHDDHDPGRDEPPPHDAGTESVPGGRLLAKPDAALAIPHAAGRGADRRRGRRPERSRPTPCCSPVTASPCAGGGMRFALRTWHRRRRPRRPRSARRPLRRGMPTSEPPPPRCAWHRPSRSDRDLGQPDDAPTAIAIDHVVVHTTAPERAIALWRDRMGLRLALDREFPARHLRLLFFRSGGITLEYASPLPARDDAPAGDDRLHGVSYRVTDLSRASRAASRGRRRREHAASRACGRGHDGCDRALRDRRRAHAAAPGRRLSNRLLQAVSTSVDGRPSRWRRMRLFRWISSFRSPIPIGSTSTGAPTCISPSATASISACELRWPGSRRRSRSASSSSGTGASPSPVTSRRSSTTHGR